MCIRDSITGEIYPPTRPATPVNGGRIMKIKRNTPLVKHTLFIELWIKYLTSLNKNKKSLQDKLMDKISTVSYTHLDVYKRQFLHRMVT